MPVVCYHSVDPLWDDPLAALPERFEEQCAWLSRRKTVIPAREHVPLVARNARAGRRTTSLTFDDGFAALYDHAMASLVRHRLPATVLLVTGTLEGGDGRADWLRPQPEVGPAVLTRDQVLEMQDAGIEFGSHSWAHHDLRTLSEEECLRDLRDSRVALEDLLGRPVPLLAYPYGFHAPHVRRAARLAGYDYALSLPEGREHSGSFAVPRVGIYRDNDLAAVRLKTSRPYLGLRTGRTAPAVRRLIGAVRQG